MRRCAEQGFSLVEVLVAMTLSAVVLMSGMTAVLVSARFAQQGRLAAKALALAQSRVEAKRSVRWEGLLLDDLDLDDELDDDEDDDVDDLDNDDDTSEFTDVDNTDELMAELEQFLRDQGNEQ